MHSLYNIRKIGQNRGFWAKTASFNFSDLIRIKKTNSNLDQFKQLLFHTLLPSLNFIYLFGLSADAPYFKIITYIVPGMLTLRNFACWLILEGITYRTSAQKKLAIP